MKKWQRWVCVLSIFLIYFGVAFLDGWFRWGFWERHSFIFTVGYFGFVILVLSIFSFRKFSKEQKAKDEYNQTVIPKNVGARSYIDEDTGAIYLRSADYARVSGREWVVSSNGITINLNDSTSSRTIPFSQIKTLRLNATSPIASMSFDILGPEQESRTIGPSGDFLLGETVKTATVRQIPIHFNAQDIRIAEAVRDRVAGATN